MSDVTDRTALRLVPAVRCAMESDLPSEDRIPFSVVDPHGLVAMTEFLAGLGFDVDEIALGKALNLYLETVES